MNTSILKLFRVVLLVLLFPATINGQTLHVVHTAWVDRFDLSGTYVNPSGSSNAFYNGYPTFYRQGIVTHDLSHLGYGPSEIQLYMRFIPGIGWQFFGDIIDSRWGETATERTYDLLPSFFNGYFPKCGSFGNSAVSGPSCTPDVGAIVPQQYAYWSGQYVSIVPRNGKKQFELKKPSQEHEGAEDVSRIAYEDDRWIWTLETVFPANTRASEILEVTILSESMEEGIGDNPPCDGWTNGFSLSGGVCTALPVRLASFEAKSEETAVAITWTTAAESNSDRFEVEYSRNSIAWQRIATIVAHGESSSLRHYRAVHLQLVEGLQYYRLKMIDKDGTYTYSMIRSVDGKAPTDKAFVYPNPVRDRLFLQSGKSEKVAHVKIDNLLGLTVLNCEASPGEGIPVDDLAPGLYFVSLFDHDGKITGIDKITISR